MNDYEKYVTEVNRIFSILEKLKNSWTNNDSLNTIEEINEFKNPVIQVASFLEKEAKDVKDEEMLSWLEQSLMKKWLT